MCVHGLKSTSPLPAMCYGANTRVFMQALTKGNDAWSIAELVHAIVLIVTFTSLSSLIWYVFFHIASVFISMFSSNMGMFLSLLVFLFLFKYCVQTDIFSRQFLYAKFFLGVFLL